MIDEQLAQRVGLYALGALVLVIGFFVFVFGRIDWGAHVRVRVYFHHAGALHEGAPFVVAGRSVGKVESIALVPARSGSPGGPLGNDSGVAATVAIDARVAATLDPTGDVFIASKGTLSDRYLELGPGTGSGAPGLRDGEQLVGRDPPQLDRVLERTWDNLEDLGRFVAAVKPELDALRVQVAALQAHFDPSSPSALPNAVEVAPLVVELGGLGGALRTLRETDLGGDAGLAHLGEVIDRAGAVAAAARTALGQLDASAGALRAGLDALRARVDVQGQGVIANAELAIDRIRADVAKLDPLLATVSAIQLSLARGEGSLMKLSTDPEFPEDAKELGKILKRHPWRILEHPIDRK